MTPQLVAFDPGPLSPPPGVPGTTNPTPPLPLTPPQFFPFSVQVVSRISGSLTWESYYLKVSVNDQVRHYFVGVQNGPNAFWQLDYRDGVLYQGWADSGGGGAPKSWRVAFPQGLSANVGYASYDEAYQQFKKDGYRGREIRN